MNTCPRLLPQGFSVKGLVNNLSPNVTQPLLGKGVDGKTRLQAPVAGKTAHANKAGLNDRRVV